MTTWQKVMKMKAKDTRHRGIANTLSDDDLSTLIASIDYWGGNTRQAYFDLKIARYRVFDWLAMAVMGGRIGSDQATKVLVYSFLKSKGDINAFIDDLRYTDYEIVNDWQSLELSC